MAFAKLWETLKQSLLNRVGKRAMVGYALLLACGVAIVGGAVGTMLIGVDVPLRKSGTHECEEAPLELRSELARRGEDAKNGCLSMLQRDRARREEVLVSVVILPDGSAVAAIDGRHVGDIELQRCVIDRLSRPIASALARSGCVRAIVPLSLSPGNAG